MSPHEEIQHLLDEQNRVIDEAFTEHQRLVQAEHDRQDYWQERMGATMIIIATVLICSILVALKLYLK